MQVLPLKLPLWAAEGLLVTVQGSQIPWEVSLLRAINSDPVSLLHH